MRFGIIGAGVVGTAVGVLLKQKGYQVAGVASRSRESAERAAHRLESPVMTALELSKSAALLLITTSDSAIEKVAAELAARGGFFPEQVVVHFSGSLTTDVLEAARSKGAYTLSVHPIQSCATVERAVANLPGSVFSIQGDEEAYPVAEQLVKDLDGQFFSIDKEAKPLYHAAACVASNFLVTLLDFSRQLMLAAGMPPEMGYQSLFPLVAGTLDNIKSLGTPQALTGPIARGDWETVRGHLESMAKTVPELEKLYRALAGKTLELAMEKGSLNEQQAFILRRMFSDAFLPEKDSRHYRDSRSLKQAL